MTLLDRFRTQPPLKHPDPAVRLSFVQDVSIDERALLGDIAREDLDARVRRAAVSKLLDPAAVAAVAAADQDESVREAAVAMLRDIALDAFEGLSEHESLAAVEALSDGKVLGTVAKSALREEVALRALSRVSDPHTLGSIARHAQLEPIRLAALAAVHDRAAILAVALNSDFKDTAVGAADRLEDRSELEQIVARGKNRAAIKRARTILRELDERAAAEAAARAQAAAAAIEERERELMEQRRSAEAAQRAEADARRQEEAALDAARAAEVERVRAEQDHVAARRREEDEARERQRLAEQTEEERRLQDERAAAERQQQAERMEADARDARTRQEALARLTQLAVRVESCTAKTDLTLKAGERALRDARSVLADLPPLPSRKDHDDIVQRLRRGQTELTAKVNELRELVEWKRWANLGILEQLCVKMEGLAALENPVEIARHVHELQDQWRAARDAPHPQSDLLWRRFKAAHDVAWARCEAHFAAEAAVRAENLAKKTVLCERAEALSESTRWIQTAEEIKGLQAEWKTIGPVTRGQEKAVWERFRTACDRFFTRRQADLAELKKRWAANLEKKEALCARAEALVNATDWEATAAEIRRLQQEWKAIGPVKKNRSEAIWERFRGACDQFFVRYAQRHDIARGERVAAREALCGELESMAQVDPDSLPAADLFAKVRSIRTRWQQEMAARGVDRERAAALDQRFADAFARVLAAAPAAFAGSDLDPDANQKRMESLVRRIEDLANSVGPSAFAAEAALSPTTRAAALLREALAANTIGGKVDEDARLRAAADEMRQAQASWSRIGPVPEERRRPLADRFAHACRRITERAAQAGRPVSKSAIRS